MAVTVIKREGGDVDWFAMKNEYGFAMTVVTDLWVTRLRA
jgi:hypothetical protein